MIAKIHFCLGASRGPPPGAGLSCCGLHLHFLLFSQFVVDTFPISIRKSIRYFFFVKKIRRLIWKKQYFKLHIVYSELQKIETDYYNYTMYTGHVLFKNMSVLQLSKTLNIFLQSFIIHWYASKTNIHNNTFLYLQKTVPFYLQLNSIYFFPANKNYELIRSYNFYPSAKRMSLRQNWNQTAILSSGTRTATWLNI